MLKTQYQQCVRCVMDTSDPTIHFSPQGICNHCTTYLNETVKPFEFQSDSDEKLKSFVKQVKTQKGTSKYDCILGLSGGVDSSFLAYKMKNMGLNPLLLYIDNQWNSESTERNLFALAKALELDLEVVSVDWKEYREIQLAFLKSSILDNEIPIDLAIPAILHQTAKKHGVKAIFSGGNYTTEGILPLIWGYHVMKDKKQMDFIIRKFGNGFKRKNFPTFGLIDEIRYKFIHRIKMYYPLNYIRYEKLAAKAELESFLNCTYPVGKHHENRFTRFWHVYVAPTKYGIDYRKANLSSQICNDFITREEAIALLKEPSYNGIEVMEEIKYISDKLQISIDEFESYLKLEPKFYTDFPNSEKKIKFVHAVYKWLFKRER